MQRSVQNIDFGETEDRGSGAENDELPRQSGANDSYLYACLHHTHNTML